MPMYEYELIRDFYGIETAKRSKVPLINHIDEGLLILEEIGAPSVAKEAFCLHPLVQHPDAYAQNYERLRNDAWIFSGSLNLAIRYRDAANAYLCTEKTDNWTRAEMLEAIGEMSEPLRCMLIADKRQNMKDFMVHHYETHPRSKELTRYFYNWLEILGVVGVPVVPNNPAQKETPVEKLTNVLDIVFGEDHSGRTTSILRSALEYTNEFPNQITIIVSEEATAQTCAKMLLKVATENNLQIDHNRVMFADPNSVLHLVDDLVAHHERICLYVDAPSITDYQIEVGEPGTRGLSFREPNLMEAARKVTQVSATSNPPKPGMLGDVIKQNMDLKQ